MRRKRKEEHRLLIAQNFLGNISLSGKHDDTKLRIFNAPGLQLSDPQLDNLPLSQELSSCNLETADLRVSNTAPDMSPRELRELSPTLEREELFSKSFPSCSYPKRRRKVPTSLLRRFVKILSSDDVIQSRESRIDEEHVPLTTRSTKDYHRNRRESIGSGGRPPSPISDSQFLFFRKIRTSIGKGERSYLCSLSTLGPFAVLSHFAFVSHDRHRLNRSHSTLATSMERMRHISQCSVDELKPYDFDDDEVEISFGHLFGRRRGLSPCVHIAALRRSDRRDSNYVDSVARFVDGDPSDTLGTMASLATKDPSFEPDEIEWDEPAIDAYSPSIFEDIEASRKTVFRSPGYIGVTLQYSNPEILKNALNQSFSEKFPRINLTYSKYKSIVNEMITIARQVDLDLATTAQGIVFFERIVHKALVSKPNRKVVAGTSLLVAMKLNDYSREHIKEFLELAIEKLRIARKEMIALEIPLCAALQFQLQATPEHVAVHYGKLLIASG